MTPGRLAYASTSNRLTRSTRTTRIIITASIACLLSGYCVAQTPEPRKHAPACEDLVWSARFLAANPEISSYCRGVYVKNNEFFAKLSIELLRVRGNRLSFRPVHEDGRVGSSRSIRVKADWRVNIDGQSLPASALVPGQTLNVYIPEDRFALTMDDGSFDGDEELISIEDADESDTE